MKTPSKSVTYNRAHGNRGSYERTLSMQWIKLHRPDIMKIIKDEADKKYPLSSRKATALPKSLCEAQ